MRPRMLLSFALAAVPLLIPLAAEAAIPFFGPIFPASANQCAASWGLVMTVINNVISFLITVAIVFVAPLMIAWSGFLFVVNPVSPDGKEKAKKILTNTIVGIVLALAGWLIVDAVMAVLYNPDASSGQTKLGVWSSLVTGSDPTCIDLPGSLSQVTPGVPPPEVEVPPPMSTDEQSVRDLLAKHNITINKLPCAATQMTGPLCGTNPGPSCTNVAGLQPATIQQIINIANACGGPLNRCGVQVTGGTEPGHACGTYSHENGYKVDLWQTAQLNEYLEKFAQTGQRGGHFSGPIRKDTCENEYVKESSPTIWDITVKNACGTAPPGTGTGPTVCPAASGTVLSQVFAGPFNHNFWVAPSGTIVSAVLPNAEVSPKSSGILKSATSPSAYSPSAGGIEVSISKCPGVIDTDYGNFCNRRWSGGINSMTWFKKVYNPTPNVNVHDTASAAAYHQSCWAPESEGMWYLNIRYTYAQGSCGFGATTCGYNWQWLRAY